MEQGKPLENVEIGFFCQRVISPSPSRIKCVPVLLLSHVSRNVAEGDESFYVLERCNSSQRYYNHGSNRRNTHGQRPLSKRRNV